MFDDRMGGYVQQDGSFARLVHPELGESARTAIFHIGHMAEGEGAANLVTREDDQ